MTHKKLTDSGKTKHQENVKVLNGKNISMIGQIKDVCYTQCQMKTQPFLSEMIGSSSEQTRPLCFLRFCLNFIRRYPCRFMIDCMLLEIFINFSSDVCLFVHSCSLIVLFCDLLINFFLSLFVLIRVSLGLKECLMSSS